MAKPILYLFIGYPGAGKTSLSKLIAERSGAVHLWADDERHKMFGNEPTHSREESIELYNYLNHRAGELLGRGEDVVFDTNFNYFADRDKLRDIAEQNGGQTRIIWLTTPREVARDRSVCAPGTRNGYSVGMSDEQFDNIADKLEIPGKNEKVIKIDGAKLDEKQAIELLGL